MRVSEQGLALIKQFEGFAPRAYICPAGKQTIGYGHVVRAGDVFDGRITEEEATALLHEDIKRIEKNIGAMVKISLSQNQFDALVSFCYNVGTRAFERSTMLRRINENNLSLAATEFDRWVYVNGKTLGGLIKRRKAEKTLFLG